MANPNPNRDNLRPPWKPGESGNPAGRRPRPLTEAYSRMLETKLPAELVVALKLKPGATWLDAVTAQHFRTMLKTTETAVSARKETADRIEGKPVARVEFSSDEQIDINVTFEPNPFSNKRTPFDVQPSDVIDVDHPDELPEEAGADGELEKE